MAALLLGCALAVAGLLWVLVPLLRGVDAAAATIRSRPLAAEPTALEALREIEFDHATGKLSPEDYAKLRAEYVPLAVAELRVVDAATAAAVTPPQHAGASDDPAELLIARAKSRAAACAAACATCGPRPEPDALFCSSCARYLGAACLRCGAAVEAGHARFCTECGESLAA